MYALEPKIFFQCPAHVGSEYFNYKGTHSIVLLAIADANYNFSSVHIGACGRRGNAGIFRDCEIGQALENRTMKILNAEPFYDGGATLPYVLVGDEAFPLSTYMMRPYSAKAGLTVEKRIYNYRLSRARRIVENFFGILASQWRILRRPIEEDVNTTCEIVKSIVCLHNWLGTERGVQEKRIAEIALVDREGLNGELHSGTGAVLCNGFQDITRFADNTNITMQASYVRNEFCRYFNDEGQVP